MILYNRMYLNKEMRAFSAALPSLRRSHANLCRAPAFPVHVPLSRLESLFYDAHLRQSASAKSV